MILLAAAFGATFALPPHAGQRPRLAAIGGAMNLTRVDDPKDVMVRRDRR